MKQNAFSVLIISFPYVLTTTPAIEVTKPTVQSKMLNAVKIKISIFNFIKICERLS